MLSLTGLLPKAGCLGAATATLRAKGFVMSPKTRAKAAEAGSLGAPEAQDGSSAASKKRRGRPMAGAGAPATVATADPGNEEEQQQPQRRRSAKVLKVRQKQQEAEKQTTGEVGASRAVSAGNQAGDGGPSGEAAPAPARSKRARKEIVVPEPPALCFSTSQCDVRVGTSGYSYPHWRRGFYAGLPQRLEWERYIREFDMLEINSTFYGWHKEHVFDSWRQRAAAARPTFEYVVKAQQFYTHRKRLNVDDAFLDSWRRFWACCERLRPHLGPVLFQFPASFRTTSAKGDKEVSNIDRLRRLGQVLPAGGKVFEFRDASWFCPEVYEVLRRHDWCLAITHCTDAPQCGKLEEGGWIGTLTPGPNPRPEECPLTSSWGVYVRFHGSEGQYRGEHGPAELRQWAARAKAWAASGRRVYFAFNNDAVPPGAELPSAIQDCRTLAAELRTNGVWPD